MGGAIAEYRKTRKTDRGAEGRPRAAAQCGLWLRML